MPDLLNKAGRHWDDMSSKPRPEKTRFWQHPEIISHINKNICGKPVPGRRGGVMRRLQVRLGGDVLGKGISVGCGNGRAEMDMLESGLVQEFDVFELSKVRIREGRELAKRRGLDERIRFTHGEADKLARPGHYDLVFWGDALHHMLDVHQAVGWSKSVLRPGGFFVMDDFIGPSRFQWSDFTLSMAARLRNTFPDRLLVDPRDSTKRLSVKPGRPSVAALIADDPTEAADSERILDAVRTCFPDADVTLTGGVIYAFALNDVLANMTPEDASLLELCLLLDDLCIDRGESLHAVAMARKGHS